MTSPNWSLQPNLRDAQSPLPGAFWFLVVIVGIGAGLGAGGLMGLLRLAQHVAWPGGSGDFLDHVQRAPVWQRILVLLLTGAAAGMGRLLIKKENKGHAGDLSEAIWRYDGELPFWPTLTNALVSITLVGLGSSLGREGAIKQVGALIAGQLALLRRLSTDHRRLLISCGVAAGISAAYNVPFGGALFALEILLGTITLPAVLPALVCSMTAAAVSWCMLGSEPTYHVPLLEAPPILVLWAVVAGALIGVAAVPYIRLVVWADSHHPKRWRVVAAPVVVFLLLGVAAVWFPQTLGNGRDLCQRLFTGDSASSVLPMLLVLKTAAVIGCLASGAPGGLFTPTMTCGALVGALLGQACLHFVPDATPGVFAIIGAGALLASATQAPASSIVLTIELTHRVDGLLAPLIAAIATAMVVTRRFEPRSIYTARVTARQD